MILQPSAQLRGRGPERFLGAGREHQGPGAVPLSIERRRLRTRRRFCQDHVRVGTAKPKRIDAGHANTIRVRKRFAHHRHPKFQGREVDVWIGRVKMKASGNEPVLQHQCRFDQSGHTGRGFQVAKIRFG